MIKILIFGKNGQVATELATLQWPDNYKIAVLGRGECDLMVKGAVSRAIGSLKPDVVINAAAYTAVDKAEGDRDAAYALNADAPSEMAIATAAVGAKLIHISTDYVFDGQSVSAYREDALCAPVSVYGASKLAGETRIRSRQQEHVILRTSWVFSPYGNNFVRTMLRLGAERDELAVVGDQMGGPTAAKDIASALAAIAAGLVHGSTAFGTYHFAGAPATTWFDFASAIFANAAERKLKTPGHLRRITTADYPTPAIRPANSVLDCSAISRDWNIAQPNWQASLTTCVDILTTNLTA
jgi:dTDP-4-dehydrorhamnose reductase